MDKKLKIILPQSSISNLPTIDTSILTDMKYLTLSPGDIVVVKIGLELERGAANQICTQLRHTLNEYGHPNVGVMVMGKNIDVVDVLQRKIRLSRRKRRV